MRLPCLLMLLLLPAFAPPAAAACAGEELFSCEIGKKRLEVCLAGSEVSYRFGPEGKPEIALLSRLRDTDFRPWSGIGRAIQETVSFANQGITYEVWGALDRLAPEAVPEGGVNVLKGEELLASLDCKPGGNTRSLDRLYEAKTEIGQCWDFGSRTWRDGTCPG